MMKRAALLLLLVAPCLAAADSAAKADDHRLFDIMKLRSMAAKGIPASAATAAGSPDLSLPENDPAVIKRQFAEGERERAAAFDKQFSKGAFAGIVKLSRNCQSTNGCDLLAVGGLIEGSYLFVALDKDVAKGLSRQSADYKARRRKIMTDMAPYLERLQPNQALRAGDAAQRRKALDPIAKGIATP